MVGRRHYGRWALLGLVAAFALTLVFYLLISPLPDLSAWRSGPPQKPWAAASRQMEVWEKAGSKRNLRFSYVPLEQVSDHLLVAILVGEDINFFQHKGVDFSAWPEAFHQWVEGRRLRGASTITQQLAKNLFLSRQRSLARKLAEARLAWHLEKQLGKRRILELYVNIAEFGPGIFGVEAASQAYFGCAAKDLTATQAASLAAAIPAPARDNPKTNSARFRARREVIAERAAHASWLYTLVREAQHR
ncbi:MAG: monofunctional biosynthetic peptidoglycan transglycosylase [Thermoanaerobaculum sp.]